MSPSQLFTALALLATLTACVALVMGELELVFAAIGTGALAAVLDDATRP